MASVPNSPGGLHGRMSAPAAFASVPGSPAPAPAAALPHLSPAVTAEQQHALMQQAHGLAAQIRSELQAQLAAEVARLQQSVTSPAPAASSRHSRIRPEPPKIFDSTDSKYTVHDFVWQLDTYFTLAEVTADHERYAYAGSRLYGPALTWFRGLPGPMPYPAFRDALLHEYRPVHEVQSARDRLHACRMEGSNLRSYTQRFRALCYKIPDLSESEKFDKYYRGLPANLQTEIRVRNAQTFEEAVRLADHLMSSAASAPSSASGRKPYPNKPYSKSFHDRGGPRPAPPAHSSAVPMELGAVTQPQQLNSSDSKRLAQLRSTKSALTADDREFLKRIGACFVCRQLGHTKTSCPASKNFKTGQQRQA